MTSPHPELVLRRDLPGSVTVLTLNRPQARNAINLDMATAIVEAVTTVQSEARCLVITGTDPAFCAGLDLRDLGTEHLADLPAFIDAVAGCRVPVIAAVNGPAVTGGFEVALACDFIVASERARFADTHVRVGVYPGPVLVSLPRRVGMAKAREMSMTGDFVAAEEALRMGLANHVVPHHDLLPFTLDVAGAIAEQDPAMIATMREDWDQTGELALAEAHAVHRDIAARYGYSHATRELLQASMDDVVARARRQGAGGASPG